MVMKKANNIFGHLRISFQNETYLISEIRDFTFLQIPWSLEHSISVLEIFQPPASFATDPTKRCWKDPFYVVLLTLGAWESEVDVNMLQKK